MSTTSAQRLVENEKVNGKIVSWLMEERLAKHNEPIRFYTLDGMVRVDAPCDFATFEWLGDEYEVQGYDRAHRRWWVKKLKKGKIDTEPANIHADPLGGAA